MFTGGEFSPNSNKMKFLVWDVISVYSHQYMLSNCISWFSLRYAATQTQISMAYDSPDLFLPHTQECRRPAAAVPQPVVIIQVPKLRELPLSGTGYS